MQQKQVGASLLFFTDGSAEIHTTRGFVLTHAQNLALREFIAEQMDETLTAFENEQRLRRYMDNERVIPFPVSKELN